MLMPKQNREQSNTIEQDGISRHLLMKYIRGSEVLPPPLSREEETHYIQQFSNGSMQARQTLIERNLRFVVHIAKRFDKANIDIEDIISVGSIGLIKAINTYKPDKKIRLATYSSRCIQNEILTHFRKSNKYTDISFDELLDTGNDESGILSDILGTDKDMVEKAIESEVDKELLHKAIENLTAKEQEIIILRFGLNGHKEHTQKEVSKKMNISQSHISKLEQRIYSRLKENIKN